MTNPPKLRAQFALIRRYLDRAGLFLWCAADGSFVLSEPNGKQAPLYQLTKCSADGA